MPKLDLGLPSYDSLFSTEKERQESSAEKVMKIPIDKISDFKGHPFLKEVDSLALANVQLNQRKAFKEFFRSCKTKQHDRGFPKFKSAKTAKRSYTTNNQNGTIKVGDRYIRLPKIGKVKAVVHRRPNESWKLKSATVSQSSGECNLNCVS